MKVRELIAELSYFDPELEVVYSLYSEYTILDGGELKVLTACQPRHDGWVHARRPDQPTQTYLLLHD